MYGTLISSTTVGAGGTSGVTFSSIPQTPYTDLIVVISGRSSGSGNTALNLNGSASGFSSKAMYAFSSATQATYNGATDIGRATGSSDQANNFGAMTIRIPNYTNATNKPYSVDATAASYNGGYVTVYGGVWSNTAAITSVTINAPSGTTFVQYTTVYLYGITKGSGGATVS
jgi:hypothetical protein